MTYLPFKYEQSNFGGGNRDEGLKDGQLVMVWEHTGKIIVRVHGLTLR